MIAAHSEKIGVAGPSVAEYRALLAGLEHASSLGLDRVEARCDAKLVVEHVTVVFVWVPADANGSAHALVADALGI